MLRLLALAHTLAVCVLAQNLPCALPLSEHELTGFLKLPAERVITFVNGCGIELN